MMPQSSSLVVGIDVSAAQLDVALDPSGEQWQIATDEPALHALVTRLQPLRPSRIIVEATGGLETPLVVALGLAGLPVVVINPRHVRHFARASGQLAKTDLLAAHLPAAREWCAWKDTHVSLAPGHTPDPRFEDPEFSLRFARLVTHYWNNSAFLEENQLLRDAPLLNGMPGVLIHGHYDVSSPLETPRRLSQRWTTSRLHILDDSFSVAATRALNQFATD